MSLISDLLNGAAGLRAEDGSSGAPAPWDDFWYMPVGAGSSTGMRITPDTVKRVAAALACVGLISRMMAAFPSGVFKEMPNGGKQLAKKHRVNMLLSTTPNERQTRFEWVQMMQGWLELRGNAYSEIVIDKQGWPEQLLPLHPDHMQVEILSSGRLRYRYNDPLTAETRLLVQDQVFHLRNWSDDGIVGQSTVRMGVDIFGTALAAQEYSARFFENDAQPGGIITGANFRTTQDRDEFLAGWQRQHARRNRFKLAVLSGAMKFEPVGVHPADAQLLDARKFSRVEICSMFGVPPFLIGDTEKTAAYASTEQANIMFGTQCLWPRIVNWEQTCWRDLIQDPNYFAKWSMAALLRGDTAARYAAYQVAIQNGWMSQNEVRILEDLNPVLDGDYHWRPTNWSRLGDVAQPNPTPTGGGEGLPGSGEEPTNEEDEEAQLARLKLMASSAAARCVRKEIGAMRKLLEGIGGAIGPDSICAGAIRSFYSEHARFVADVLCLPPAKASDFCSQRAQRLITSNDAPHQLEAFAWQGERELAELAVR
jgi:HK97 family phage portal protein